MNADDSYAKRFHVGSTIAGRYRVERPIGEGAMGAVALARHVILDETVAIKFLPPELRRDPVANARLSREAKALARIKSDHVARVLDVGATLSVGPYMVMEYLEGTDLGEVLETEGPLPVARAVECILQVCEALTVAHTAGITHRDIKPQNLFLARHGQFETLKILDFGIAEDGTSRDAASAEAPGKDEGAPSMRAPAAVYGTPPYMAPERVRNEPEADHRSDIWSVGVVLHELVTGRAVFDAPSVTETCARIVSNEPIPLDPNDAVLPPSLRAIIARCMERDPARRFQSVEELAAALAPLATMHERFRGRSTGAFSRSLFQQERQPVNPPHAPPAAAPRWQAAALALERWLDELRQRPGPVYVALAAASLLVLALGSRCFGDARWMAPPPKAAPIRAEPRPAAHGIPHSERSAEGAASLSESVLSLGAASPSSAAVSSSAVSSGAAVSSSAAAAAVASETGAAEPAQAPSTGGESPEVTKRTAPKNGEPLMKRRLSRVRLVQPSPPNAAGKNAAEPMTSSPARRSVPSIATPAAKPADATPAPASKKAPAKKSRPLPRGLRSRELESR